MGAWRITDGVWGGPCGVGCGYPCGGRLVFL